MLSILVKLSDTVYIGQTLRYCLYWSNSLTLSILVKFSDTVLVTLADNVCIGQTLWHCQFWSYSMILPILAKLSDTVYICQILWHCQYWSNSLMLSILIKLSDTVYIGQTLILRDIFLHRFFFKNVYDFISDSRNSANGLPVPWTSLCLPCVFLVSGLCVP